VRYRGRAVLSALAACTAVLIACEPAVCVDATSKPSPQADDSMRIERPVSLTEVRSCCDDTRESTLVGESSRASTNSSINAGRSANSSCCGGAHYSSKGQSCAPRASASPHSSTTQYFKPTLASPLQHFEMWLKLSLYPALCHTVLCQRQCALNGYESCNALGVKRSLLVDSIQNQGSCGAGGCSTDEQQSTGDFPVANSSASECGLGTTSSVKTDVP
jgi:hypothetical protein